MMAQLFRGVDGWVSFLLDGALYNIPPTFRSDGITCPRVLKRILGLSRYELSGRVHDWLYSLPMHRAKADWAFWGALRLQGCPARTAYLAWVAVRLFGWYYRRPATHTPLSPNSNP